MDVLLVPLAIVSLMKAGASYERRMMGDGLLMERRYRYEWYRGFVWFMVGVAAFVLAVVR